MITVDFATQSLVAERHTRRVLALSVAVVACCAAAMTRDAGAQGVKITDVYEIPERGFSRPPAREPTPDSLVIGFDQLRSSYSPNGEFLFWVRGERYGFESLSFAITETHPGGGAGGHTHDTEEAHVVLEGEFTYWMQDPETMEERTFTVRGPYIVRVPAGFPHSFINSGPEFANIIAAFPTSAGTGGGGGPSPLFPGGSEQRQRWLASRLVRGVPLFRDGDSFEVGSTSLQLVNDAGVPLRVVGTFEEHESLVLSRSDVDETVPPHSVSSVEVRVTGAASAPAQALAPVVLEWAASYGEDVVTQTVEGHTAIHVIRLLDLVRRDDPVVVDGRLTEWGPWDFDVREPAQVDVDASSWEGPDDCSWRFSVAFDDEHLYLAVEVTDERNIYLGRRAWEQDGIEIRVDARLDPDRSLGTWDGHILVAISPGDELDDMVLYPDGLAEKGIQAIGVPTDTGHAYEVAVPIEQLAEHQGADWDRLRVNVAVDDYDDESGPLAQLWWQPDWRDPVNVPGSGTFRRAR